VIQFVANSAGDFVQAASLLEDQADAFDLNLGCPLRLATAQGMGTALAEQDGRVLAMLSEITARVARPVTVKLRIPPGAQRGDLARFAAGLEEAGAAAIVVHARTPRQGFAGRPDWSSVRAVRETVGVPVIANGGIRTAADIRLCREETGCEAVMIGSGAFTNPFIARDESGGLPRFAKLYALQIGEGTPSALLHCRAAVRLLLLRARLRLFVLRHSVPSSPV
jgi:tRNA-dihydrouridine synthase